MTENEEQREGCKLYKKIINKVVDELRRIKMIIGSSDHEDIRNEIDLLLGKIYFVTEV